MHTHHQLIPASIITKSELDQLRKLDREIVEIRIRRDAMNSTHFSRMAAQARADFREGDASEQQTASLLTTLERLHSPAAGRAFEDVRLDLAFAAITKLNRHGREIIARVLNRARNELSAQLHRELEFHQQSTESLAETLAGPMPCTKHELYLREMLRTVREIRYEMRRAARSDFHEMPPDVGSVLARLGIGPDVELNEFATLSDAPDVQTPADAEITAAALDPLDDDELLPILARQARLGETFEELDRPTRIARILSERAAKKPVPREELAALDPTTLNAAARHFGVATDGFTSEEIIENLMTVNALA